jgi:hypothetical protein
MKTLPFEPIPGSKADLDYMKWVAYLDECEKDDVKPSLKDFLVWLEEHDDE